jgi:hypothetical protein
MAFIGSKTGRLSEPKRGGYRITPAQQIDFHIGIGFNDNAPAYILGIGYSFRLDGLLR